MGVKEPNLMYMSAGSTPILNFSLLKTPFHVRMDPGRWSYFFGLLTHHNLDSGRPPHPNPSPPVFGKTGGEGLSEPLLALHSSWVDSQ